MSAEKKKYFKGGRRILNSHFVIDPDELPLWNISYSMQGEDLVLRGLLKARLKSGVPGFYADFGSYDPRYGNNTYLFYRYGWRGVCVEANPDPDLKAQYAALRPGDLFLNAAVGEAGEAFWAKNPNTPGSRIALNREDFGPEDGEPVPLKLLPLKRIFDKCAPPDGAIDLMSMDIEGSELSALRSNDWTRYRPKIILIEVNDIDVMNIGASEVLTYLRGQGYKVEGVMHPNAVLTAI